MRRGWQGRNRVHDMSDADRFWEKVSKPEGDGCWLWQGSRHRSGYGVIKIKGRVVYANVAAWFFSHGEWPPPGLLVCHRCDVRDCVRPEHLFLGTNQENLQDASRKGRLKRKPR